MYKNIKILEITNSGIVVQENGKEPVSIKFSSILISLDMTKRWFTNQNQHLFVFTKEI